VQKTALLEAFHALGVFQVAYNELMSWVFRLVKKQMPRSFFFFRRV
jgi:hypothetical protein